MKKCLIGSVTLILLLLSSCRSYAQPEPVEVTPSLTVTATEDVFATGTAEAFIKETAYAATEIASNTTATVVQATEESLKNLQATQTAAPLLTLVEGLNQEGVLHSTTGIYYLLENYECNWAQTNSFRGEQAIYSVENFLIKADIDYESSSQTTDWSTSGCGFTFREGINGDLYLIFSALDGKVYFGAVRDGELVYLGDAYYGQLVTPAGSLELMLAIENDRILAYVNGVKTLSMQNDWFKEGFLNYALITGNDLDFGTTCKFSNIELWKIISE